MKKIIRLFAKGLKCIYCKNPMTVVSEDKQSKGSWVVYSCSCGHKEKVFEDN